MEFCENLFIHGYEFPGFVFKKIISFRLFDFINFNTKSNKDFNKNFTFCWGKKLLFDRTMKNKK